MDEARKKILESYSEDRTLVQELLFYNSSCFGQSGNDLSAVNSLQDEPHILIWMEYAEKVKSAGFSALKNYLIQLQFPVQEGISATDVYRLSTRKGQIPLFTKGPGVTLECPEQFELKLHPTLAGTIPVMLVGCREDFVILVQALTKRNEPHSIPDSMGACIVGGYNNWDRIRRYRQQWMTDNPHGNSDEDWSNEFQKLIPQKELYQDRFIILSKGPYSNVDAQDLGLSALEWKQYSLKIRLEHECTHYCTRRFFNSMRNNILDELIADYMGIVAAIGYYRADWFLRFLGLEAYPSYRESGRLSNYRGDPKLSSKSFKLLQHLIKVVAKNLEKFDRQISSYPRIKENQAVVLYTLTSFTLEELASVQAVSLMFNQFHQTQNALNK